ncbi:MAG: helix-turn-helix transcriptional regulator [Bacteroidetes bacterium]|nr:helix-turn-helix transcriptional regulator [Bacteroidota bacterium]
MVGGKIRTFRMLRGFSQEHMAAKLGIDQTKYSRIESSKQKTS